MMQRIDESTYIDDTLVTCAEYQLFIDEMREQGQYYQPDHWTSYQFPKGQAREPILGIRHADAVAFCGWLIKRDNGEWKYRLPTQVEANAFPMKSLGRASRGYWIEDYKFTWIETVPKNAYTFDGAHARAMSHDTPQELAFVNNRALDNYIDLVALQDRIAGRSPAFEGIRLVKERIR